MIEIWRNQIILIEYQVLVEKIENDVQVNRNSQNGPTIVTKKPSNLEIDLFVIIVLGSPPQLRCPRPHLYPSPVPTN